MNTSDLLKTALLHNGMHIGEDIPQMTSGTVLSSLREAAPKKKGGGNMPVFLILTAITIFLLAGYAPASQAWVYKKMDELLLIPREEPFTALHFEYYDDLPTTFTAGEMINFTFTIKNSEGKDKEYVYDVYFKDGVHQGRIPVDKKSVFIKNGESQTIAQSYIFTANYPIETLFVELPESGQKIHFALSNNK